MAKLFTGLQIMSIHMDPSISESLSDEVFYSDSLQCNQVPVNRPENNLASFSLCDFEELYAAKSRLLNFATEINQLCLTPIRKDVIEHCNKFNMQFSVNISYDKVKKIVQNRIEKMIKNKKLKKNWSSEDVIILIWVVSKFTEYKLLNSVQKILNIQDWNDIAQLIPGAQGQNCMFKWLSLKKNNLSDNNWSQRQSRLLRKLVQQYGQNGWSLVSQTLYYSNASSKRIYRCPKQCRQHWNCYLNPKLKKGPWSIDEDNLLLSNILKNNGQKRWAEMIKQFQGRTQNALKNRYTLLLEKSVKILQQRQDKTELELIKEYLEKIFIEQFVSIKSIGEHQQKSISLRKKNSMAKKENFNDVHPKKIRSSPRQKNVSTKQKKSLPEPVQSEDCVKQLSYSEVKKQQSNKEMKQDDYYHYMDKGKNQLLLNQPKYLSDQDGTGEQIKLESFEDFPEIKDIKILPFNDSLIQTIKSGTIESHFNFIPCILSENTLRSISQ